MDAFLILAGQLFIITCIQSILEVMASARWQSHLQKPISLGCYLASLLVVLRFMQSCMGDVLQTILRIF